MMHWLSAEVLIALATLTFLEIVLGVDNIIFISILSGKLPPPKQRTARPPNTSANQTTPLLVGLPYWRTTASSGTSYHSLLKRTQ